MTLRKRARTLTGVATVITLLGLIIADALSNTVALALDDKLLLVAMISALLGVDIAVSELSVSLPVPFSASIPVELSFGAGADDQTHTEDPNADQTSQEANDE